MFIWDKICTGKLRTAWSKSPWPRLGTGGSGQDGRWPWGRRTVSCAGHVGMDVLLGIPHWQGPLVHRSVCTSAWPGWAQSCISFQEQQRHCLTSTLAQQSCWTWGQSTQQRKQRCLQLAWQCRNGKSVEQWISLSYTPTCTTACKVTVCNDHIFRPQLSHLMA